MSPPIISKENFGKDSSHLYLGIHVLALLYTAGLAQIMSSIFIVVTLIKFTSNYSKGKAVDFGQELREIIHLYWLKILYTVGSTQI